MTTFRTEADILINRSVNETFEFLCSPNLDRAELTPLEDTVTPMNQTRGVGATRRMTIELAARKLNCLAHCVEFEPPHRLVMRVEGDLEGMQAWKLVAEGDATRAYLTFEVAAPVWTPAYLHDQATAERWSRWLAEETLAKVKALLEA